MQLTAYLDFWFTDRPFVARVAACAALGLRAVQVWSWRSRPMDEIAAACRAHGLQFSDTFDEQSGSLVDAADHACCLEAWAESLEMAVRHGVQRLYMFSNQIGADGWAVRLTRDYTPLAQYGNLLEGAARVMQLVERTPITVWFEALNTQDLHGPILIHSHDMAADVVRRINHPQLRLAFDCYHQQRTAGNLIAGLRAHAALIDTVHFGDVPTRQEPGTGEINFAAIAREIAALGLQVPIGLEFTPSRGEAAALAAVRQLLHQAGLSHT
jgi:hydroxypyruvate isomerase